MKSLIYSIKHKLGSFCFHIRFWFEKWLIRNREDVVRIDGEHYIIGREEDIGAFRGFAGRYFKIYKYNAGVIETTNLWHQGSLPNWIKAFLPDNATFIKEGDKYV